MRSAGNNIRSWRPRERSSEELNETGKETTDYVCKTSYNIPNDVNGAVHNVT